MIKTNEKGEMHKYAKIFQLSQGNERNLNKAIDKAQ